MKKAFVLCFIFLFMSVSSTHASSFFSKFIDQKDGKLDASEWLDGRTGFLPVPILITEPAVGVGLGVALAFFHDNDKDKDETGLTTDSGPEEDSEEEYGLPPSVSVIAGAYTENGSWFAGGGHIASWKDDTIRYQGFIGVADLNLKFYGLGDSPPVTDNGLKFDIKGTFLSQELKFRIKESNFFLGGKYTFLKSETEFDLFGDIPGIPKVQMDTKSAGLGILGNYDNRDNTITPNKGHNAKLEYMNYNEAWGGDSDYYKFNAVSLSYWKILPKVVLGVRADIKTSDGDIPFYDVPFIELRGIPALRYQGESVFVGELDVRWDFTYRWSLVGFAGSGWAADNVQDFDETEARVAGGFGLRYFLARKLGLRAGFDIAWGPEDTVFYMQVGSAW